MDEVQQYLAVLRSYVGNTYAGPVYVQPHIIAHITIPQKGKDIHTCTYPKRSKTFTHAHIPQKVKEAEDLWVHVLLPYDGGNSRKTPQALAPPVQQHVCIDRTQVRYTIF